MVWVKITAIDAKEARRKAQLKKPEMVVTETTRISSNYSIRLRKK